MADAKKCDRCGVLFEPYEVKTLQHRYARITSETICVKGNVRENIENFDLCSECARSFNNWINFGGDKNEQ